MLLALSLIDKIFEICFDFLLSFILPSFEGFEEGCVFFRSKTSFFRLLALMMAYCLLMQLPIELFVQFLFSLVLSKQLTQIFTLHGLLIAGNGFLKLFCLLFFELFISLQLFFKPLPGTIHCLSHAIVVLDFIGVIRSQITVHWSGTNRKKLRSEMEGRLFQIVTIVIYSVRMENGMQLITIKGV